VSPRRKKKVSSKDFEALNHGITTVRFPPSADRLDEQERKRSFAKRLTSKSKSSEGR
jgi:hypothetical protein